MSAFTHQSSTAPVAGVRFQETIWGQVLEAGETDSPRSQKALEELCQAYWGPLHSYLRRRCHSRDDARDRTQAFFQFLLRKNLIRRADPGRGRFRSFLLTALKNFVINEAERENAQRRGGKTELISLDDATDEGLHRGPSRDSSSPETLFDYQWAQTVLKRALERCREEYAGSGKLGFAALQPMLVGEKEGGYAELAAKLNKSEGALRVAVQRLRKRYRALIREVIRETVASDDLVEEEFMQLKAVLRERCQT